MQDIINTYLTKYLPRRDILHRLPVSVPISKAWPEIQRARQEKAQTLPLTAVNGEAFWCISGCAAG